MTASPRKQVRVMLRDATGRNLKRSRVESAAQELGFEQGNASEDNRLRVSVDGQILDAIPLVSRALTVPADAIRLAEVIRALNVLGFSLMGAPKVPADQRKHLAELSPPSPLLPVASDQLDVSKLQRHIGEWVAVAGSKVIGHAASLKELDRLVGDQEAMIAFIPDDRGSL